MILILGYFSALTIFGLHTYTKNTISHGYIFYPLNSNVIPDSAITQARDYRTGNRVINFVKSNFASTAINKTFNGPVQYKLPFTFSRYEIERYAFAGIIVGGFGVLYSGILVLCLIFYLFLLIRRYSYTMNVDLILHLSFACIAITIIINPLGYIARYIPQYYLVPFLLLIFIKKYFDRLKHLNSLIIILLCLNSFLIGGYTYYNFVASSQIKRELVWLSRVNKPILVDFQYQVGRKIQLTDYKIKYIETNKENLKDPRKMFRTEVLYQTM